MSEEEADTTAPGDEAPSRKPVVVLVVGMAGSGKTTLLQRLNSYCHQHSKTIAIVNLDPAVSSTPYGCHIDIGKTVDYHEVMKQYELGPNGAILTSLNLFSTKFDQVITYLQSRESELEYVFVDTPGQIEIFTWSASGQIVTECFASSFPTCVLYVVDTPRSSSPVTFMSNMLYACSILYKFGLPFLLAFNKIDIKKHDFAVQWMTDFQSYSDALGHDDTYASSLSLSMSLVLEEFYHNLSAVGVSAITGEGMDDLFAAFERSRVEYRECFLKELLVRKKRLEDAKKRRVEGEIQRREGELRNLGRDFEIERSQAAAATEAEADGEGVGEEDGEPVQGTETET